MFFLVHVEFAPQILVYGLKAVLKVVLKELFEVLVAVDATQRVISFFEHFVKCDFSNRYHTYP